MAVTAMEPCGIVVSSGLTELILIYCFVVSVLVGFRIQCSSEKSWLAFMKWPNPFVLPIYLGCGLSTFFFLWINQVAFLL